MKIADIQSKQLTKAQQTALADALRLYTARLNLFATRVDPAGLEQAKQAARAAEELQEMIGQAREMHLLFD